jgi:REP element-mobilizing transposase RayT
MATHERQPVLLDPIFGGLVAATFEMRADGMDIGLDLYCVMPHHVHLLVQIRTSNLVDYVRDVKSRTTQDWWAKGGQGRLWQRSFHDRGRRTPQDYDAATHYILENPIEAGLVDAWENYPLIGGALVRTDTRS